MKRKQLTQVFPFLIPLRRWQRKLFFYIKMRFDSNSYTKEILKDKLPFRVYEAQSLLLNDKSGFDMQYQVNKVHNLKLVSRTMDRVMIRPGKTFSFWQLARCADKYGSYKDGLCLVNGRIVPIPGGGLCQLSNLLFWLFLHTPLTIVERHHHGVESFPLPASDIPDGTGATVNEGWLDLKVRNETDISFQVELSFDEEYIHGAVLSDENLYYRYEISSRDLCYYRENGRVYQQNSIYRTKIDLITNDPVEELLLYNNRCQIGYELPGNILIAEKGE
jgi:vancomycin resistance protein VanW